jgi:hypothetical protein
MYPVKIEFKEYPSGSWEDWSEYLAEVPDISIQVESDNPGEAGAITFDNARVTFRYEPGNAVYLKFSIDLTVVQRYLFKISILRSDGSYQPKFEGIADFSSIQWNEYENIITFNVVDKLSALNLLTAEQCRLTFLIKDRLASSSPISTGYEFQYHNNLPNAIWISGYHPEIYDDLTSVLVYPGEVIDIPEVVGGQSRMRVITKSYLSQSPNHGKIANYVEFTPYLEQTNFDVIRYEYPGWFEHKAYSSTFYDVDINNITADILTSLDGFKIIKALYNQAWPGTNLILRPSNLSFNVPAEYAIRLIENTPFGKTPFEALITLINSVKPTPGELSGCYVYVDSNNNLVIQSRQYLTSGTQRTIGTTKILNQKRKYFWDKLADGATVNLKSWVIDKDTGNYIEAKATATLKPPGATGFIKPKNEIKKDVITIELPEPNEDPKQFFAQKALEHAQDILNFYGKRRETIEFTFNLDDNTIGWSILDYLYKDTKNYFFTKQNIDPLSRQIDIEAVEISGFNFDPRLTIFPLSDTNLYNSSSDSTIQYSGGITGGGTSYVFLQPLELNLGQVKLNYTDNLKLTDNKLDTAQPIKTTNTPTFAQVVLSNPGTSTQAVRGDRQIATSYPLTGGGDLTANRSLGLSYNTTNLKLTSNALNTIQDIATTSTPTFAQVTLNNPGTSTQAVRGDRIISTSAPLTGGGDLTANRTLGLSYNTTNLKLTSNALNTIQDIATTSSPTFNYPNFTAGFKINNVDSLLIFRQLSYLRNSARITKDILDFAITDADYEYIKINYNVTGNIYLKISGKLYYYYAYEIIIGLNGINIKNCFDLNNVLEEIWCGTDDASQPCLLLRFKKIGFSRHRYSSYQISASIHNYIGTNTPLTATYELLSSFPTNYTITKSIINENLVKSEEFSNRIIHRNVLSKVYTSGTGAIVIKFGGLPATSNPVYSVDISWVTYQQYGVYTSKNLHKISLSAFWYNNAIHQGNRGAVGFSSNTLFRAGYTPDGYPCFIIEDITYNAWITTFFIDTLETPLNYNLKQTDVYLETDLSSYTGVTTLNFNDEFKANSINLLNLTENKIPYKTSSILSDSIITQYQSKIGIGVTNPTYTLDVSGTGRFTSVLQTDNIFKQVGTTGVNEFNTDVEQKGNKSFYNAFASGWTGAGWRIDYGITATNRSHLELDDLTVRGTMRVYELIINQIRATNGSLFVTSSAKVASKIRTTGDPVTYSITFEDPEGHGVCPFLVNDIILVQRVRLDSITIVKQIVCQVTSVTGLNITANVISEVGEIDKNDLVVRIGNTSNTARQGSVYLTSDDSNAPFIDIVDGVNSWSAWGSSNKLKVRLGKLTGVTDSFFGVLSGYGLYAKSNAYLRGKIYAEAGGWIAGWNINAAELTSPTITDGASNDVNLQLVADTGSEAIGIYLNYDLQVNGTPFFLSFGNLKDGAGNYTGRYGISFRQGSETLFELSNNTFQIAGWFFDTQKFYKGAFIELNAFTNSIGVNSNAVKMFYTGANSWGIEGRDSLNNLVFQLGSTNKIAGWNFTNEHIYKLQSGTPTTSPSYGLTISSTSTANVVIAYGSNWQRYVKLGYQTSGNWFGIEGTDANANIIFQLGSTNKISGWNFDLTKLSNDVVSLEASSSMKGLVVDSDRIKIGKFTTATISNTYTDITTYLLNGYSGINASDTWWASYGQTLHTQSSTSQIYLNKSSNKLYHYVNTNEGQRATDIDELTYGTIHRLFDDVNRVRNRKLKFEFKLRGIKFATGTYHNLYGTVNIIYFNSGFGILKREQILYFQLLESNVPGIGYSNALVIDKTGSNAIEWFIPANIPDLTYLYIEFIAGFLVGGQYRRALDFEVSDLKFYGFERAKTHINEDGIEIYNSDQNYFRFKGSEFIVNAYDIRIAGYPIPRFLGKYSSAPTTSVQVGDIYINSTNNNIYMCYSFNSATPLWKRINYN